MRIFLIFLIFNSYLHAKVDPPNYNFSLDELVRFQPNTKLDEIKKNFPKLELLNDKSGYKTYKVYISHIRYRFPLLFQVHENKVTDFYARLPAYFLHDIFHQSLINRFGKQDKYKKHEEQAIYIWQNKKGINHIYEGACSITCFPVYYSQYLDKYKDKSFKPIIKQMHESLN